MFPPNEEVPKLTVFQIVDKSPLLVADVTSKGEHRNLRRNSLRSLLIQASPYEGASHSVFFRLEPQRVENYISTYLAVKDP